MSSEALEAAQRIVDKATLPSKRPTVAELEAILARPDGPPVSINVDGSIGVGPSDALIVAQALLASRVVPLQSPSDAQAAFLNRLRSLFNIDGYCLPELDKYDWAAFRADPPKFFMRCEDDKADAIWREVEKRQTKQEVAR